MALTKDEVLSLQAALAESLRRFSVTDERDYQPDPSIVVRPSGQRTLFRPFTSSESIGTKIIVTPAPTAKRSNDNAQLKSGPLRGLLTLCHNDGSPNGVLNAEEITGCRTALIALIPFMWRRNVNHVVVFGAGKQALWHIRLALALRGDDVKSVTVLNRSACRAEDLAKHLREENQTHWRSDASIVSLDISVPNAREIIGSQLSKADVVFCAVPSKQPLFQATDLRVSNSKRPYISAVGSWQPEMLELDPALLVDAANGNQDQHGYMRSALLVDDRASVMRHSGEALLSCLPPSDFIELGEVIDARKVGHSSPEVQQTLKCLQDGMVVFKSVGVGIVDLAMGEAVLNMAREKNAGAHMSAM